MKKELTLKEISEAEGIILGKNEDGKAICLTKSSSLNKNIIVCGGFGTGKSRCFINPMIYERIKAKESIIVTDCKDELRKTNEKNLKEYGYEIKLLDTSVLRKMRICDLLGENIIGAKAEQRVTLLVDAIIKNTKIEENNPFLETTKALFLKSLILYVGYSINWHNERSLEAVYKAITTIKADEFDILFDQWDTPEPCKHAYNLFNKAGVTRDRVLEILADDLKDLKKTEEKDCIMNGFNCFIEPGQKPCAYFIRLDENFYTAPIFLSLFSSALKEYADNKEEGKVQVPTYFLLDEFVNIGAIPNIENFVLTMKSRDLYVSIVVPAISTLIKAYPQDWRSIIKSCDTQLFYKNFDNFTAEYVSELIGFVNEKRKIMSSEEICEISAETVIIVNRDMPAQFAKKVDYTDLQMASSY